MRAPAPRDEPPRCWVLNLDAEMELEAAAPGSALRYTPSAAVKARTAAIARTIELPPGDRVIDPLGDAAHGCSRGRAWCPTPRALTLLRGLPIDPPPPSVEVLRGVNERGLAHALSEGELEGALRATHLEQVERHVAQPGRWLAKRAFGVAGRGQRPLSGPLSTEDRRWIEASLRTGALYVEPRVEIVRELSVHGWASARVEVRSIREQTIRERAWVASALARELDPAVERALVGAGEKVGAALLAAGYRGPFGLDAYLWRAPRGLALRTLSEINARYCMGWDDRDGWDPPGGHSPGS